MFLQKRYYVFDKKILYFYKKYTTFLLKRYYVFTKKILRFYKKDTIFLQKRYYVFDKKMLRFCADKKVCYVFAKNIFLLNSDKSLLDTDI